MSTNLTTNYRSSPKIIQFSSRYRRNSHETVQAHIEENKEHKIKDISSLNELMHLIKSSKNYSDWAILYKNNEISNKIWGPLINNNIHFQVSKFWILKSWKKETWNVKFLTTVMKMVFFENWELKDKVFRVLRNKNPDYYDNDTLIRTIQKLKSLYQDNLADLANEILEEIEDIERDEMVEKFINWIGYIQKNSPYQDPVEILANLEALAENPKGWENTVTLSTIHSAKGLEWKNVVIVNFDKIQDKEEGQDKNLAYVASSRAKHNLFLLTI